MAPLKIETLKHLCGPVLALACVGINLFAPRHTRPSHQTTEIHDADQLKREEAMAFVLGWQSKLVLLQGTPHKPTRFHLMNLYMNELGVTLPRAFEYYSSDPSSDQGARAEA